MEWLSIIPPIVTIALAVWKREVILALVAGLFASEWLLAGHIGRALIGTIERLIAQVQDAGNARVLMFSLLVGALIAYVRESGGVSAFVRWVEQRGWARTPRQVSFLCVLTGCALFIESNLSIFGSCLVATTLFDRHQMSRARLAYFADSTCPPVKVLVLLNGWGAYALGLLQGYGLDNPVSALAWSVPLNFYCWLTLLFVFYTAWTGKVFGPMQQSESRVATASTHFEPPTKLRYFLAPILTMTLGIVAFMAWTGDGNIMQGSGSKSVLWATAAALLLAYLLLRADRRYRHRELVTLAFKGMAELLPLVTLVLLAIALGAAMKELGTGHFVAGMVGDFLPLVLVTPLVFVAGCLISFSTGTSWGTFAIMMPIAMPLAASYGIPAPLMVSAVLGGGVFGDHCSGISDTAILSSLASGCDHYEHVRTQLPYAVTAATASIVLYLLAGLLI